MYKNAVRYVRRLEFLIIMGLLLVFIPVNATIIILLYSLFRNGETNVSSSVEGPSVVYLTCTFPDYLPIVGTVMFVLGIVILAFVFYQRRRVKSKVEIKK